MGKDTIAVMTARGPARILREGGSQAWVLNPRNAAKHTYVVMVQNQHNGKWGGATEPHGTAFMIGKISEVVPSTEDKSEGRYMIRMSEYARIDVQHTWKGANPIKYVSLEELGINIDEIQFLPMPPIGAINNGNDAVNDGGIADHPELPADAVDSSSLFKQAIDQAKAGLAAGLGIRPDQIEITISA